MRRHTTTTTTTTTTIVVGPGDGGFGLRRGGLGGQDEPVQLGHTCGQKDPKGQLWHDAALSNEMLPKEFHCCAESIASLSPLPIVVLGRPEVPRPPSPLPPPHSCSQANAAHIERARAS